MARGAPHPIAAPFALERFTTGRLIDEAAAAAVAH
jgi:sarcosine oxidase subunit beta